MLILGIETSCDETAASLIEVHPVKSPKKSSLKEFHRGTPKGLFDGVKIKVLSNTISSQVKLHTKYGGIVPSLAAREHVKNLPKVLRASLGKFSMADVDLIAVTRGPGLVSSLLVGTAFAKTLAWKYKKPIIGVNHLEGHIVSNWLAPVGIIANRKSQIAKVFPALCLVVSGGHTELVLMKNHGQYKIVGETMDDAVGEAFDKVARLLSLGYPGGPLISKLAEKGNPDKYPLPRPMIGSKNYNFSYSGLKTAVLYLIRDLKIKKLNNQTKADIAASFQKSAIDVLVQKTIRAAKEFKVKSILLSGGVSANSLLRSKINKAATELRVKYFQPKLEYTGDNAAMIAIAGYFNWIRHVKTPQTSPKRSAGQETADWQSVKVDSNLRIAKAL